MPSIVGSRRKVGALGPALAKFGRSYCAVLAKLGLWSPLTHDVNFLMLQLNLLTKIHLVHLVHFAMDYGARVPGRE
jgi:hypothetical protein